MTGRKPLAREDWPKIAKDLGRYDICIARDGTWYHEGNPIRRLELVKLFASVLRCDDQGQHWLITPVEKGRIEVEEVAFLATQAHVTQHATPTGQQQQVVTLTTNLDEQITLDAETRLHIADPTGQPRPYVSMRDGLQARLTPSVFYELIALGAARDGHLWLSSNGCSFDLGSLDDGTESQQETPA